MNQSILPSRKVVAFVIVPLCTIFVLWLVGVVRENQVREVYEKNQALSLALGTGVDSYNTRDTDGDLLKDWEEFLYETDIERRDTDGDGLDDYAEALDPIRDPLVSDSELGLSTPQAPEENAVVGDGPYYTQDESLTQTDKFARDIFNTFSQLKQSGNPEQIRESVVETVARDATLRAIRETQYTREDIDIVPSQGITQDREKYLAQYQQAIEPIRDITDKEFDLLLLARFSKNKDQEALGIMRTNVVKYQVFIGNLLAMEVPESAVNIHVELINNYDIVRRDAEVMSRADSDPIGALTSSAAYYDNNIILQQTIYALSLYLHAK